MIKNVLAIQAITKAADILSTVGVFLKTQLKVGVTGHYLNQLAHQLMLDLGGAPSFLGYHGFLHALCISVNDTVIHGIPNHIPFQKHDLISIDIGVAYQGYHADAAFTVILDDVTSPYTDLVMVTEQALQAAIDILRPGVRIGDISATIQSFVESRGFFLPKEFAGHGIGASLHEAPLIPNVGKKNTGMTLQAGMVICIEPMVQMGDDQIYITSDG